MNGFIIVNKEKNYTSRDVVNVLSKKFNTSKVGHTGTLDPIATGVLVVAIGSGLKLVDIVSCNTKEYIATVKMGIETDTLDITGNIIEENNNYVIEKEKIEHVLETFLGDSIQEVPLYSSIKVNGKRLYEYARKGEKVELPKRNIKIFDISLVSFDDSTFKFKVKVSKGTYIRSLIRDIGKKLNIPCCMLELNRIKQGNFSINDSYSLEDIKNDKYEIIPLYKVLNDYEFVFVDKFIENKVLNGRVLDNRYKSDKIAFLSEEKRLLALYKPYEKDFTKVKPIKVLSD